MAIRARENLFGAYAFLVGIILAIAVGLFTGSNVSNWILGILSILGLIVGIFVAEKDVQTFLLASVSLVIVSYAGISGLVLGHAINGLNLEQIITSVMQSLLALFVPATIVVAIKTVFSISKI